MPVANLLEAPVHKIEDRRAILERVLAALLADPDCRYDFRGIWRPQTFDEEGNELARKDVIRLKNSFPLPVASDV